jgi:hypothetical protein
MHPEPQMLLKKMLEFRMKKDGKDVCLSKGKDIINSPKKH